MEINKRILIVDDNASIHDDFRKILCPSKSVALGEEYSRLENSLFDHEGAGDQPLKVEYELDSAYQGEAALAMIIEAEKNNRPYSIVFTDVRMPPGFDGVQLVSRILKHVPYTEIVIVTAFSDYSWEEMTSRLGWTDRLFFLRKPFDVITVRQIALTLTKKWSLGAQARALTRAMELNLLQLEKRVEERTAKLVQANKDLQNFAYIVSHDLNSPLLSIQGFVGELRLSMETVFEEVAELLPRMTSDHRVRLEDAINDQIPEALDFIDTSATKMDSLIKAILKLSRLGYREFRYEPVDLIEVVDQNLKALAYPIEKRNVNIDVDPLPTLITDRLTIEQIIGNLLSNAIKFLDPQRPGRIVIKAEQNDAGCVLSVRDNGCGIAEKDLPFIFDIFRRGCSSDVPGEGMGLAFVKTLINHLGGRIWCDSQLGAGTTFSVLIPQEESSPWR